MGEDRDPAPIGSPEELAHGHVDAGAAHGLGHSPLMGNPCTAHGARYMGVGKNLMGASPRPFAPTVYDVPCVFGEKTISMTSAGYQKLDDLVLEYNEIKL